MTQTNTVLRTSSRTWSLLESLLLLFLLGLSCRVLVEAQTKKRPPPPSQSLGDVLLLVLDSDKDQKVTLEEVNTQLAMMEQLFAEGEQDGGGDYLDLLRNVQAVAPQLFDLLDSNRDKALTKSELKYVTKLETSLKKDGKFKPFVRECFELLDTNPQDEQLSLEEFRTAEDKSHEMAVKFHAMFPLRKTADELEDFVQSLLLGMDLDASDKEKASQKAFEFLDADGDGSIQRKEVGHAYNVAGKKFMEISKTIKQMGPMFAMFGGGAGGGGDMGNMFNNMNIKTEF